jgi:hypothetical protein
LPIPSDFHPEPLEFTEVWRLDELVAIRVHIDCESVAVPREEWGTYLSGISSADCALAFTHR